MKFPIRRLGVAVATATAILCASNAFGETPDRVAKKVDIVDTVWIWKLDPDGDQLRVVTAGKEADGSMGPVSETYLVDEHTIVRSGDDVIQPSALKIGDRVVIEATEEPDIPKPDEETVRIAREVLVVVDPPPAPENEPASPQ